MRSKITCNVLCEKPKSKEIRSLVDEYIKRIPSLNLVFVKDVEKSLASSSYENVVLLDERGTEMSSVGFSHFLSQTTYTLAIGPAQGFSADVKKKYKSIKLSSMTLPHEFAALLLIEQIYRAHTILAGIPYHKD